MTVLDPARADDEIFYPETDGQPIAESDFQRGPLLYLVDALGYHARKRPGVGSSRDPVTPKNRFGPKKLPLLRALRFLGR